ncbi:hypothetical protein OIU84_006084 [Salix udensis]|uniref:Uncharacterized protein n=1 Tax=Salix udensis TaxID=889485 RepID=A0AAD6JXR6_9ROSI|nr:hypothetical protein OIU84_006084 [Salix udensis]
MTTGEEAEAPVAEQPLATEEPKVEEKPVKEKKPRTPREKKPRQPKPKTVAHPPYFQMIKEAILALNEKEWVQPICNSQVHGREAQGSTPCKFQENSRSSTEELYSERKVDQDQGIFQAVRGRERRRRALQGKSPMEGVQ